MSLRFDFKTADPAAAQVMATLQKYVRGSSLPEGLVQLIYTRVSQINGCALCLDMHAREAREAGETEARLYALSAWRETPFFSPQERAALALAECVTCIAKAGLPDDIYEEVANWFEPEAIMQLLMAINTINCWNRISIATGMQPAARG